MNVDIYKAGGVLINNRKLLIARKKGKDFFMAPGGKIEDRETSEQALIRELYEEFGITTKTEALHFFGAFTHPVVDEPEKIIHMEVFIVREWDREPAPSREIEEIRWIMGHEVKQIYLASIFAQEVVPRLIDSNLID